MTESAIVYTDLAQSCAAGRALGLQIREAMLDTPDVVIVFAAPTYDQASLLHSLKQACPSAILLGCSSAGEFTSMIQGEGMACALALHSTTMKFSAAIGRGVRDRCRDAAQQVLSSFRWNALGGYRYRSALVLTDALAGHADVLVEHLTRFTGGTYQFFGGGAGDNAQFMHTPVFYDTEVVSDAVVALEILSQRPVGIGVYHGWSPASEPMRATRVNGTCLVHLDDRPAVEAFQAHAQASNQVFDPAAPMPFFLHNLIGIECAGYVLRVPLEVYAGGSIRCAAPIPPNARVYIMNATPSSPIEAAERAAQAAQRNLFGAQPALALFFDCVATRLRMGKQFGNELEALRQTLGPIRYIGCNSHGQIARAEGQLSGFHNCTAVVCLLPQ
ncbi:MAG: FIST C-terminal domain-containing protein [Ktedonobacteraceae bacterium]|nr:FIST C-terminal domain-containing protein [Ktedonobacteraceae bacterium]